MTHTLVRELQAIVAMKDKEAEAAAATIAALQARVDEAEKDVSKLDYVLDVLGIADSDRDPADCVKEWIVRAEAAEAARAALEVENAGLRRAVELILPLAKGYAPAGQTDQAKRTCRSWIEAAEEALSAPSPSPSVVAEVVKAAREETAAEDKEAHATSKEWRALYNLGAARSKRRAAVAALPAQEKEPGNGG